MHMGLDCCGHQGMRTGQAPHAIWAWHVWESVSPSSSSSSWDAASSACEEVASRGYIYQRARERASVDFALNLPLVGTNMHVVSCGCSH